MTAAEHLQEAIDVGCTRDDHDHVADHRAEVRRQVLGDDLNPSTLVLDAQAYRRLADDIAATMTDPDRWDGDEPEDMVLGRYVKWLAAGRVQVRAEVLAEAAAELDRIADTIEAGAGPGSAQMLRDAAGNVRYLARKDTRESESTEATPDFFQPGRTYRINDGAERADFLGWLFRTEHVSHQDGKRVAFGYLTNRHPDATWNPHFESEESWAAGWDDITDEVPRD